MGGRAKRTGHLYPRRNPWYSLSEAESTSGHMVLWWVPRKKSPVTPPGIDPWTVRLVTQCVRVCVEGGNQSTNSSFIQSMRTKLPCNVTELRLKPIMNCAESRDINSSSAIHPIICPIFYHPTFPAARSLHNVKPLHFFCQKYFTSEPFFN